MNPGSYGRTDQVEMTINSQLTVRDRIAAIQKSLRDGSVTPALARESLVQLTALYGNVLEEQRDADHEYKLVLLGCLQSDEAANRARIRAEVTPQFQRARAAKDMEKLVIELVRSCKKYLSSLDEEMRLSGR
jgi:hypothetical protein